MRRWICFPLLLVLLLRWNEVRTQMENRVVFLPGIFQTVTLSQNETVQAMVSRIPTDVAFITLQFHALYRNATLSYSRVPSPGLSQTAADLGLLSPLKMGQTSLSLFLFSADADSMEGIGVMLPYSSKDPVPGACNMEFNLDIDPNVYIQYNLYETTIRFAPANIGYERGGFPPLCDVLKDDTTRWRLQYDVYQYFLPENDLSERSLFGGLQAVADIRGVTENFKLLKTLSSSDMTTAGFNSIPGQGVIYTVIVRDPLLNTSASYIPAHTYACSFTSNMDSCQTLGKISTKVLVTIAGLAGLFVCFFGHRFFKCELFFMGFSFAAFVFFVLFTRTTALDYDLRVGLAALLGVVGGAILVMSWWRFGSVMACILVVGLILGFLISSTVLFTPLSDISVFRHSSVVFWVTFCCIMIIVPVFFVRWPREGNIVACGVVGAYAVVLAVNAYVYTSLSYITLNILKRFLNSSFSTVFTDVPFQTIDYIMIAVWMVLCISGIVLQLYRERLRPFFPPSPYLMWQQERERRRTNVLDPSHHFPPLHERLLSRLRQLIQQREPAGEHTPLLL
ncbi:transmembrane 7 superfamily member 3 [Thalassophryne amazonica]|uniref:transmembrane 7 superfamily member 3 n=1 Tax=Thalassophryne amazonica TaxID=390379 RepID=UPI0014710D1B|nr:transmembrane 7 superfamily member 3 [Thalassophryne amazonica]XP_034019579.1 transmembrane 7 superfamily member 3 [Thalassophryne amazonica]